MPPLKYPSNRPGERTSPSSSSSSCAGGASVACGVVVEGPAEEEEEEAAAEEEEEATGLDNKSRFSSTHGFAPCTTALGPTTVNPARS